MVSRRARALQLLFFLAALAALLWLLNKVGWSNIGQALVSLPAQLFGNNEDS